VNEVPTSATEACFNADDAGDDLTPPPCDLFRRHCLLYRPSHAQGAELLLLGAVFRRR
jgi:hypothetical protein